MTDDETKDEAKEAESFGRAFVGAVHALRSNAQWAVVRREIENRIKHAEFLALAPADSQEQWIACERAKGALVALKGLLVPFDARLPEQEDEDDVG